MSPDSKPPWLPPPAPKMIRRRENGKQADAPCFQESSPCFLSVICFWRNYLKSLIPLSDLPVRAQSPPCFSWKISLFLDPANSAPLGSCGRPHADLPGNTQRVCDEMQYILERTAWVEIICTKANC